MSQFNFKTDVGEVLANYRQQNSAHAGESWDKLEKSSEYIAVQNQISLLVTANVPEADKLQKALDGLKMQGKRQMFELFSGGSRVDFETLKKNFEVIKKGAQKLYNEYKKSEVSKKVDECKSAADASKLLKDTLTDEDIQIAGPEVQAKLFQRLRSSNVDIETHPDLLEAVEKLFKNMSFSPEYVQKSKEIEDELVNKLRGKTTTAKDDWGTLTDEKKEEFLNEVLKIQCEAQKKATGLDVPIVGVKLKVMPNNEWGEFKAGPPARINLNTLKLGDFRGIFDTIIHENTHALQKVMEDDVAKINDPGLKQQAEVFKLNENNGYVLDDNSSAYRDQPSEVDAWEFAERVMDQLLGPEIK